MKKLCYIAAAAALLAAGGVSAQELRIGFLTTTTGGGAVLGVPLLNGWKLGLEHEGWTKDGDKLGGVPTRIFYGDDQQRPDVHEHTLHCRSMVDPIAAGVNRRAGGGAQSFYVLRKTARNFLRST